MVNSGRFLFSSYVWSPFNSLWLSGNAVFGEMVLISFLIYPVGKPDALNKYIFLAPKWPPKILWKLNKLSHAWFTDLRLTNQQSMVILVCLCQNHVVGYLYLSVKHTFPRSQLMQKVKRKRLFLMYPGQPFLLFLQFIVLSLPDQSPITHT